MTTIIHVVTEGATEREVGRVLYKRGILSAKGRPQPPQWRSMGEREGFEQVIQALENELIPTLRASGNQERLLLIFDQEDAATAQDRAHVIGQRLGLQFNPNQHHNNLFEHRDPNLHVMLHVSNASITGIARKDFDGYILMLLQGNGKTNLAQCLARVQIPSNALLTKTEQELPDLMQKNGITWSHAKSWIYAYITVFQYRQSHVWFARDVIENADEQELRSVFAPLIAAWDALL
ncbi:hypothetical protein [Roseiflexus castenholzii]|uniref:Uncharacterized protein n=1 Tax=Roseiflexus castenholzii (strain DSM 13941 / HLO8) TaxID=383372 RepID=A7NRS4_ROSCS|nr:hypothetical protein [Roseiflexus castenholzii]ABU60270.1 hypothetical protein Rcas_4243 [Roseiflexus castenholzii DSM 13941]